MFATPAATRRVSAPRRAAATDTSGNENAARSPRRSYAEASGGAGSRTPVTSSPGRSDDERAVVGRRAPVEIEQRQLPRAARGRGARRSRRTRRAPARGRTDARRCSRRARARACGGRRSARSRCRRRRASSATRRRGSTSSACAGRDSRRPCRRCGGAARRPLRPRSRRRRTTRRAARRELGERHRGADPEAVAVLVDPAEPGVAEVDERAPAPGCCGRPGPRGRCRRPSARRRPRASSFSASSRLAGPRVVAHASVSSTRAGVSGSAVGATAGRMRERIRDRGRGRHDRRLAEPLRAEVRQVHVRQVDEVDEDLGHVGERRHLVVVEVAVDRDPVVGSTTQLLGERVADALDDAALDLARGGERVDDAADVVDGDDPLAPSRRRCRRRPRPERSGSRTC